MKATLEKGENEYEGNAYTHLAGVESVSFIIQDQVVFPSSTGALAR